MEKLIADLPHYVELLAQFLGGLVIFATVAVRLTPSPKDDEAVGKYAGKILKFLSYLPTIGLNPQTKKIQDAYEDLKGPK